MEAVEMSKTYQYRKVMKPMLERKRRARINKCLDELKDLIVECVKDQGENFAKLEKAEILELTVDHLRQLRNQRKSQIVQNSFKSGFVYAANEVSRALASVSGVDVKFGATLMTHLGYQLNHIQGKQDSVEWKSLPVSATPLTVYCSEISHYPTQLSPISSGYGSDTEYSPDSERLLKIVELPKNERVWRPW